VKVILRFIGEKQDEDKLDRRGTYPYKNKVGQVFRMCFILSILKINPEKHFYDLRTLP
jgi:hypothetical protein